MPITVWDGSGRLDAGLRAALIDCWVEVSNAGGAVGFPFPPVSADEVAAVFDDLLEDLYARRVSLFVAQAGDRVAGWVALRPVPAAVSRHVGEVERLQTHPDHRGAGHAVALLEALERYAAETAGLAHLHLDVRGGMGLEPFYERLGWREVGRWPDALWLGPDDYRDDVLMFKALDAPTR